MNEHLSPAQFSEWILGERDADEERHVRECPQCSTELARCQSALVAFGQSAREWVERQEAAASPGSEAWASANRGVAARPWRWAAAAAIVIAAGVPIYNSTREADLDARRQQEQEDAQLLLRINTQLSRMAPASMEPLLELMQEEGRETPQ